MNRVKLLLAGLCLMASAMASASVVYTWRTSATSPDMRSVSGFIELSDAAAASGHVVYHAPSCYPWPCDLSDPDSPILRFGFMTNNDGDSSIGIDLVAGTGYNLEAPAFDAQFDVVAGRIANLALFVNTWSSTLGISGDLVTWFSSDAANCNSPCSGARGQFVAADVSEPASAALFALACLSAAAARRRQRRA